MPTHEQSTQKHVSYLIAYFITLSLWDSLPMISPLMFLFDDAHLLPKYLLILTLHHEQETP